MKKYLTLLLLFTLCLGSSHAADPKKKATTTQVFTTDIVCNNCKNKIMNNVTTLGRGVKDVQVDVATKEVSVTYDPQKTSVEKLVKGFAKLNVQATPKAAASQGACPQGQGGCAQGQGACPQGQGACAQGQGACPQGAQKSCCKSDSAACPQGKGGCAQGQGACPQGAQKSCCKSDSAACPQGQGGCAKSKGACPQGKGACPQGKSVRKKVAGENTVPEPAEAQKAAASQGACCKAQKAATKKD